MALLIVNNSRDNDPLEKTPCSRLLYVLADLKIPFIVVSRLEDLADVPFEKIKGVIMTGTTVYVGADRIQEIMALNAAAMLRWHRVPVLGICWGYQILAQMHGGLVHELEQRHQGVSETQIVNPMDPLFRRFGPKTFCTYAHNNYVSHLPKSWITLAYCYVVSCARDIVVAARHPKKPIYGVLFHPETNQYQLLRNFWSICRHPFINRVMSFLRGYMKN